MELRRNQKICDLEGLRSVRASYSGQSIVHCHGVFDVLHGGHLAYLESAKRFGDLLVVTLTSDTHVNKGPGRPYFNSTVRASMLAALEIVDYVCVSESPTATPVIEALRPNFYVKGPDYRDKARDVTGGIYEEEAAVKSAGGRLVFTEDELYSSSELINKFFTPWTEEQQQTIDVVCKAGGFAVIERALEAIGQHRVMVVGEPIIDKYVFCIPEALSSKSPSISAKLLSEESYAGGSLAIANHLSSFAKEVALYLTHGGEPDFVELLQTKLAPNVRLHALELPNIPTPRKTRFIEAYKAQRMFELTELSSDQWLHQPSGKFCEMLARGNRSADLALVADFGHGLCEREVLDTLAGFRGFLALNVQTNSSNFGFNPFTKHKKFSFLNVDTREVRVAYHDRFTSPLELARKTQAQLSAQGASFAMTMGPNGAYYFPVRSEQHYHSPAFCDTVVDPTGAGDAFFALASCLVKVGCPEVVIPFLGNVFAGLKAKIIGNKNAVTRTQLVKAVTSILK